MVSSCYQKIVYIPESFYEKLEEFENLIENDPDLAEVKINGKGSFSKFVRMCILNYIEVMQEKKQKKENQLNQEDPSNAQTNFAPHP